MTGIEYRRLDAVDVSLIIGNKDVPASDGATFERRDPVSGAVASRAAAASVNDARAAADAAAAAFPSWSGLGPSARRKLLLRGADLIEQRTPEFTTFMMAETGATAAWCAFNARLGAGMLREAAAMTTQITGDVIPSDQPGSLAFSIREAAGVVLAVAPWNAPVILGVRALALPLACGNTVVLKSSELCPGTHYLLISALRDAGFPPGVVNVVSTPAARAGEVVESLIAHPAVRRINFTGSTRVGRIVAEIAGRHLKPILLELGGKAPQIILEDADLDAAVQAAAFGAFMNQGQICMSTERIVVRDEVADAFVKKLAEKTATLRVGDSKIDGVAVGSMIGAASAERVDELVREAVAKGASLVSGGTRDATIMAPTILDHVLPSMRIYHEESFGPIASVVRVNSDEDAVTVANDTEYGLTASVFSQNIARALGIGRRVQSGMCHINGPTVHDEAQMPFGGTKASGYGRFGGRAGIEEFTELRWFTITTTAPHYPF
jgi:acyl-CoA reductase-like NAD-dependent aldehyde dehydrogenase